jgi:hypothetical protein
MDRIDRGTGRQVRKFPLDVNLPKLGCDIHRDIARGVPDSDLSLIIEATVKRPVERAEELKGYINDVWRASRGAAIQQRGLLDLNIYGGTVYQLRWEPWEQYLPYRLAVRKIPDPGAILPVWHQYDPWRLDACHIGFKISREEAKMRYNVDVPESKMDALYLEYWDKNQWYVRVEGQIPTQTWGDREWVLAGPNPYGFVPIYYIPHERTTKIFGDSAIDGQEELTRDFNSRAANLSDIVRATRPGLLTAHDIQRGKLEVRTIQQGGVVLAHYIHLGNTKSVPNASPPSMDALPMPNIPTNLISFPEVLLDFWMMISRVSPAAFGRDDTSSGRITGPATAQRMWTSMAHAATERIFYTTGKSIIDQDIIAILQARTENLRELGIEVPDLGDVDPGRLHVEQHWPPMIPLDKRQLHEELLEELREGGASIERFLREKGVEDIEAEKNRIMEWLAYRAEMEARSQPQFMGGGGGTQNEGPGLEG